MAEWQIGKEYEFAAAHMLTGHPGKCGRWHGHNYKVIVVVSSSMLIEGMVMDFEDLDRAVKPIIAKLDHRTLTDAVQYNPDNPDHICLAVRTTAENLALWLKTRIAESLQNSWKVEVTVYETSKAWARLTA